MCVDGHIPTQVVSTVVNNYIYSVYIYTLSLSSTLYSNFSPSRSRPLQIVCLFWRVYRLDYLLSILLDSGSFSSQLSRLLSLSLSFHRVGKGKMATTTTTTATTTTTTTTRRMQSQRMLRWCTSTSTTMTLIVLFLSSCQAFAPQTTTRNINKHYHHGDGQHYLSFQRQEKKQQQKQNVRCCDSISRYGSSSSLNLWNQEEQDDNDDKNNKNNNHQEEIPYMLTTDRDACGVGFIANPKKPPSHHILQQGLHALTCMEHRGGCGGDCISGDGAGIMTQIPSTDLLAEYYYQEDNVNGGGVDGTIVNGDDQNKNNPQSPSRHDRLRGVGMVFLPRNPIRRQAVQTVLENVCRANELEFLGWRKVPVNPNVFGPLARKAMPSIWQFFVQPPIRQQQHDDQEQQQPMIDDEEQDDWGDDFERTLYLVRRRFSVELENHGLLYPNQEYDKTVQTKDQEGNDDDDYVNNDEDDDNDVTVYVASFSSRTIVYKGMVQAEVLSQFYLDLQNPAFTTQFVLYHRRFSTNTNPQWQLAQPMRVVGHNGEINTLLGNVNWVKARESAKNCNNHEEDDENIRDLVDSKATSNIVELCNTQDIPAILEPLVDVATRSDSANLDAVFELMTMSRHRAPCALMALVPAAYHQNHPEYVNTAVSEFYQFHGGLLEAWDGPALLVFSDGKTIGASLDRNGLRPARYSLTNDGTVYVMSETGVYSTMYLKQSNIYQKGRLGPGQMITVDLLNQNPSSSNGVFKDNMKIKTEIASRTYCIYIHIISEIENRNKNLNFNRKFFWELCGCIGGGFCGGLFVVLVLFVVVCVTQNSHFHCFFFHVCVVWLALSPSFCFCFVWGFLFFVDAQS